MTPPPAQTAHALRDKLSGVLAPVLGEPVAVENLHALTGGASRSTWAFEAVTDTRRRLILRTGPPDDVHAGMETEARTQAMAAAAGAPVPHVLVADNSTTALGLPFLVCDFIDGETIARKIFRELGDRPAVRERLLEQCAQALAAIHRVDPTGVDLPHHEQMAIWRDELDRDSRHHRHVRVDAALAGRQPAGPVGPGDGARRLPDGEPHRPRR